MQEQALARALGGSLAASLHRAPLDDPATTLAPGAGGDPLSLRILPLSADSEGDFRRVFPRPASVDVVLIRADNSRGPGGPMGPLRTPLRTPGTLSRPSITH